MSYEISCTKCGIFATRTYWRSARKQELKHQTLGPDHKTGIQNTDKHQNHIK